MCRRPFGDETGNNGGIKVESTMESTVIRRPSPGLRPLSPGGRGTEKSRFALWRYQRLGERARIVARRCLETNAG